MDSRGYQWHDPRQPQTPSYYSQRPPSQSDYPHRPNTRDGYHSNNRPPPMPGTQGDMYHPNLDPRAGHWAQSGPREGYPVSSPPHRPDLQPAYMSTPLSRPGYHTEKPLGRSHSRQGYDYPSQNYPARDPREDYGYYDYGYQRGQHQYTAVFVLVADEVGGLGEGFPTLGALVRSLPGVDTGVLGQLGGVAEGFATLRAEKGLLVRVDLLVALEGGGHQPL
ncbi:UNVERIFIED_CONTAM: hypothetical protein FKN15_066003 [Acipenser sinensis]